MIGRRGFIGSAGAAALMASGGCRLCPAAGRHGNMCGYDDTLIDRCWLWGHETGQVDGPDNKWKLDKATSYLHMADAAALMGIHNLNAIRWDKPSRTARDSLRGLKRITWPMSGWENEMNPTYDKLADWNFAVADEMPNVTGFDLDDIFIADKPSVTVDTPGGRRDACPTRIPYQQLLELRARLDAYPRPLELRAVVYDELFDQRGNPADLLPVLELADSVTYWTWRAANIPKLPAYFRRCRKLFPDKPVYLGVYMWDFGDSKEMPRESIASMLDFGLEKFRAGEIEGFVFLCSSICNRALPAVTFAREWLAAHRSEKWGSNPR